MSNCLINVNHNLRLKAFLTDGALNRHKDSFFNTVTIASAVVIFGFGVQTSMNTRSSSRTIFSAFCKKTPDG